MDAFLEDATELLVELLVGLDILFFHLRQSVEHLLGQALFDNGDDSVVLQNLTADIEGQVGGLHHPLDETQVGGEHRLAVIHDLHPAHIEGRADLVILVEDVEGALARQIEQGRKLRGPLGAVVNHPGRVGEIVGDVLVELVVLLGTDIGLVFEPDRLAGVEGLFLRFADGLLLVVGIGLRTGHVHDHRILDEVRVLLDDLAQLPLFQIFPGVFFETEDDICALGRLLGIIEGVGAVSIGLPLDGVGGIGAGLAGHHGDLVGHHEGRIEADAELADELGIILDLAAFQQLHELLGTRVSDGAQGLHRLVAGHTDAIIAYGEGAGLFVGDELNLPVLAPFGQGGVSEGFVAGLVDRIGSVGDEFAQENFPMGIKRVDHQVEDLVHLGLEFMLVGRHGSRTS